MENLYNNSPGVVELKTSDLTKMPNNTVVVNHKDFRVKIYLLAFYAPWCGHCVRMVNDIKTLGKYLKDEGFLVGAVNCDANADLDNKITIEGFPTLFFVKDGKAERYHGARDIDSLLDHLCKSLGKCHKRLK